VSERFHYTDGERLPVDDDAEAPLGDRLLRPLFGMHRIQWASETSIEFHLSHGDWIALFRANGFEIEALIEPQVPEGASTEYRWAPVEWARQWPIEEIWKVRKRT